MIGNLREDPWFRALPVHEDLPRLGDFVLREVLEAGDRHRVVEASSLTSGERVFVRAFALRRPGERRAPVPPPPIPSGLEHWVTPVVAVGREAHFAYTIERAIEGVTFTEVSVAGSESGLGALARLIPLRLLTEAGEHKVLPLIAAELAILTDDGPRLVGWGLAGVVSVAELNLEAIDEGRGRSETPPGVGPGSPESPEPEPEPGEGQVFDEDVAFTAYRPSRISTRVWQTLLVLAHHVDRLPGGEDPIEEVRAEAQRLLGDDFEDHEAMREDASQAVPREGEITLVPRAEGVEFNPEQRRFRWTEPLHSEEFRLRARDGAAGTLRGGLSVYLGAILIAEINLRFQVASTAGAAGDQKAESTRPYRKIFASYSHRDSEIVTQFEKIAEAQGDEWLRDVRTLRSGEQWGPRLIQMIEEAQIFQLFWSWNALNSPFVAQECSHALGLGRPHFIRPVYWEDPLPSDAARDLPPAELLGLHFHRWAPLSEHSGEDSGGPTPLHPPETTTDLRRGEETTKCATTTEFPRGGESTTRQTTTDHRPQRGCRPRALGVAAAVVLALCISVPALYLHREGGGTSIEELERGVASALRSEDYDGALADAQRAVDLEEEAGTLLMATVLEHVAETADYVATEEPDGSTSHVVRGRAPRGATILVEGRKVRVAEDGSYEFRLEDHGIRTRQLNIEVREPRGRIVQRNIRPR